MIVAAIAYAKNEAIYSTTIEYGSICKSEPSCNITLNITSEVNGPLYIYYALTNFYQATYLYSSSKCWNQLRGLPYTEKATKACSPLISDPNEKVYMPCGLVPMSAFNDTFIFPPEFPTIVDNHTAQTRFQDLFREPHESYVEIGVESLNRDIFPAGQMDDRFASWMDIAPFPTFRKLWGETPAGETLAAGEYVIEVDNNYPVERFGGTKSLIITQIYWLGGQNVFFGYMFFIIGGAAGLLAFGLLVVHACKLLPLYRVFDRLQGRGPPSPPSGPGTRGSLQQSLVVDI
jgi:hypothetical protein